MAADLDTHSCSYKGFSEWWSAETEYMFQRIERWASFARGYNRLRTTKFSQSRFAMHKDDEQWTYLTNNFIVNDDSKFQNIQRIKNTRNNDSPSEGMKINCCGSFNYKSNGNLDSNCLETYSYDHSIYFKTIGDLRKSKSMIEKGGFKNHDINKNEELDNVECNSELNSFTNEMFEFNDLPTQNMKEKNINEQINQYFNYEQNMDMLCKEEPNQNYLLSDPDEENIFLRI